MMRKMLVSLLFFACLIPLFSQSAENPVTQSAENTIIGIETGVVFAYNLGDTGANPKIAAGQEFGLALTLSQSLQAGVTIIRGVGDQPAVPLADYNMFKLSYSILPGVGVDLLAGSLTENSVESLAAGMGIFYNLFQSKPASGLSTLLKIKINYLYDVTQAISEGVVTAALTAKIGL